MTRWFVLAALVAVAATAISLGIYSANYAQMPERVPIHWNIHGQPDGFTSRDNLFWYTLILPAVTLLLLALWLALPWLSPKGYSIDEPATPAAPADAQTAATRATDAPAADARAAPGSRRQPADLIFFFVIILVSYLGIVTTAASVQANFSPDRWLIGGLLLFFVAIGLVIGGVPRNFYIGVRTPWTLADPAVWEATHRFTGPLFVGLGLAGLVLLVAGLPAWSALPLIVLLPLVSVVYSLVVYKRRERAGLLTTPGPDRASPTDPRSTPAG